MRFEWDDTKADGNLAKHGISFQEAIAVFADPLHVDMDSSRPEDGELRRKVVGAIQGRVFTVVYTLRGGTIRLVSARRANPKEARSYGHR